MSRYRHLATVFPIVTRDILAEQPRQMPLMRSFMMVSSAPMRSTYSLSSFGAGAGRWVGFAAADGDAVAELLS